MNEINKKTLEKFVKLAGEELEGNWVIIGGAMLIYLGASERTTYDIDLVGPPEADQGQMLKVFQITEKLGLEIGTINQAAAFFINKLKDWRNSITLVHKGKSANIYRPNTTLYILTKLFRFTENDLKDCLSMLSYAKKNKEEVDKNKIIKVINKELYASTEEKGKEKRLKDLLFKLGKI